MLTTVVVRRQLSRRGVRHYDFRWLGLCSQVAEHLMTQYSQLSHGDETGPAWAWYKRILISATPQAEVREFKSCLGYRRP